MHTVQGRILQSGVLEAVSRVKWSMVDASSYDLLQTVSVIHSVWCRKGHLHIPFTEM